MEIKDSESSIRLIMAPLEGVTDRTFRSCYYDHFPGLHGALTPFLPIPDRVTRVPLKNLKGVALPGESPVFEIPQLLVSEASAFLTAGKALEQAGYTALNWNLGCPSRAVVRKGKGAGLMPRCDHVLSVLDRVLPRLTLKVSLKIRLGLENREESYRLIPRLNDYPLSGLTLHPRLALQMYKGAVDLEGFERALSLYDRDICYNGDIRSIRDFRALQLRFPRVKEWMIGRGLLADPFLPRKILSPETERNTQHPLCRMEFRIFIDDLLQRMEGQFQRDTARLNYLKGILLYTFESDLLPVRFKHDLLRLKSLEEWNEFKRVFYAYLDSQ